MVGTQIAPSLSFKSRSCKAESSARTGRHWPSAWRIAVKRATNLGVLWEEGEGEGEGE